MGIGKVRGLFVGILIGVVVLVSALGGAIADRIFVIKPLDAFFKRSTPSLTERLSQKVVNEESVVIDVAEKASPSVVTVVVHTPQRRILEFSPFGGFNIRNNEETQQDIGTGFVVSEDGLIITNKHVVIDNRLTYKVVTKDNKEYDVREIHRDPLNDIAVLKIDPSQHSGSKLVPLELGDSSNLKVGQFVIAIGTALGEFRHTVTTGVISGLGRGITAGSVFEGFVEELDNVIQTDAAINPGNSGGPLLNSSGQAIGVNVAIAEGAQNVGFAIPINTVKEALNQFKTSGKFLAKAYLGVKYQMVSKKTAILNDVPEGAYVVEVVEGSPAEQAGILTDDIIIEMDGQKLSSDKNLSDAVSSKKPGDRVKLLIWRDGEEKEITVTLGEAE
jgi:S1-C subfamily serine protease